MSMSDDKPCTVYAAVTWHRLQKMTGICDMSRWGINWHSATVSVGDIVFVKKTGAPNLMLYYDYKALIIMIAAKKMLAMPL